MRPVTREITAKTFHHVNKHQLAFWPRVSLHRVQSIKTKKDFFFYLQVNSKHKQTVTSKCFLMH
jgi:hypothetical protein